MKNPSDKKRSIADILSNFVLSFRVVLLIVLIASAAVLISYFVFNEVQKGRLETSTKLVEQDETLYNNWRNESDTAKKDALEKELMTKLDGIIKDYNGFYAAQRAYVLKGSIYAQKKEWDKAIQDFTILAEKFPHSYLAETAIFEAAVCQEQLNKKAESMALYKKLVDNYKQSPLVPHAYFSLGRLNEQQGNFEEAVKMYNTLKSDFSSSNWTSVAINRIIDLKAQGKIKA